MSKSLKFSLQIIAEEQKSGKTIQRVNEKILWLKNEEKYFLLAIRKPINIPIMNGVKNCSGPILKRKSDRLNWSTELMSEISNGTIGRPKILGKILAKELEIIRNEVIMIPNFVE